MKKRTFLFGLFGITLSTVLVVSSLFIGFTGDGAVVKITPNGEKTVLRNAYLKAGGTFIYYPAQTTFEWQKFIGNDSVYSKYTITYPVNNDSALIHLTDIFGNRQNFEEMAMQGQIDLSTYFLQSGESDTEKIAKLLSKRLSFAEIDISEFRYSR